MTLRYRYRKQIIICSVILLILSLTGGGIYYNFSKEKKEVKKEILVTKKKKETSKNETSKLSTEEQEKKKEIMVDVKGYVNSPGIYKLSEDNRIIDAITIAGGITKEGDTSVLNLSKKLKDEMVIIVYSYDQVANFKQIKEDELVVQTFCKEGINEVENDACIEESEKEEANTSEKISINQATKEELMTLEGVGEAKAQSIIAYREENGPFEKLEDLLNVSGIGENLFATIKENITL